MTDLIITCSECLGEWPPYRPGASYSSPVRHGNRLQKHTRTQEKHMQKMGWIGEGLETIENNTGNSRDWFRGSKEVEKNKTKRDSEPFRRLLSCRCIAVGTPTKSAFWDSIHQLEVISV